MAAETVRRRRRYSAELKGQILLECVQAGASVAKIAMAHSINANIVHGWRKLAREANMALLPQLSFVPVTVAAEDQPPAPERQIEPQLHRGPLTVRLNWRMAETGRSGHLAARVASVLRIEAIWLTVDPLDMRAGTDTALARVVAVFGAARPHHAYPMSHAAPPSYQRSARVDMSAIQLHSRGRVSRGSITSRIPNRSAVRCGEERFW